MGGNEKQTRKGLSKMITGEKLFGKTKVSLMIEVLPYRKYNLSLWSRNYFTGISFYLANVWLLR